MGFESVPLPDPMQTKIKLLETDLHEANRRLHAELQDRQRSQQILQAIVEGTSSTTGDDFFRSLVYHVAIALNVRYALVTEVVQWAEPSSDIQVRTLAFWAGDTFGNNFAYPLCGAPCERIFATQHHQCFPDQVQTLFPQDIDLEKIGAQSYCAVPLTSSMGEILGHLAVLDDKPMTDEVQNLTMLEIFAAQAVAEMERVRSENQR